VCTHPDREKIDKLLHKGDSYRAISRQFGVSNDEVVSDSSEHTSKFRIKSDIEVDVNTTEVRLVDDKERIVKRKFPEKALV